MRALVLLFGFVACSNAQQKQVATDPQTLFLQARQKIVYTLQQLPKYLCTETIERTTFRPDLTRPMSNSCAAATKAKLRKATSDRLRLDVAVSNSGEMYSWAGESRFDDRSLAELAGHGATLTGTFSAFLVAIFETDAATFHYHGKVEDDGRELIEFSYRVPVERSTYKIGSEANHAIVGYEGTFQIDPNSSDLARLIIRTDQFPKAINGLCEFETTLTYAPVKIKDSEFQLPKDSQLEVKVYDGSESANRTVFSGSHEFVGESTLRFDALPEDSKARPRNIADMALHLSAGIRLTLVLTQPIDTGTAAAGDTFKGLLTSEINDTETGIVIPKGAAVTGRVLQLERRYLPNLQNLPVGLTLETIEWQGVAAPFAATLQSLAKSRGKHAELSLPTHVFGDSGETATPGSPLIEFNNVNSRYVVKSGVEFTAVTIGPRH